MINVISMDLKICTKSLLEQLNLCENSLTKLLSDQYWRPYDFKRLFSTIQTIYHQIDLHPT